MKRAAIGCAVGAMTGSFSGGIAGGRWAGWMFLLAMALAGVTFAILAHSEGEAD